ncbi:MAG: right-handed parallel beta-helix repeat-containing protein [Saprospiraceae bacterium]|nr:right-handed parallel beta-helix repeat-containing protein [Saprospiraceae bacterium]
MNLRTLSSERFLVFCLLVGLLSACIKEPGVYDGSDVTLTFSVDTLRFDTVFTTQGSSTRLVKIFNPKSEIVRISSIAFVNGASPFFRMNVDGISGEAFQDVEILPKDSIYLFVEVTIDPDQPTSVSPFLVSDAITLVTNGNTQQIVLEAWGQNAIYIPNNSNSTGLALLSCDNMEIIWNDPRPYVIFGVLLIDSCTLRLMPGTRVHLHGGVVPNENGFYTDGLIYTLKDGRIRVEGTKEKPVIFRSDRLEPEFATLPGQWGGIRLGPGSTGHSFKHAVIHNSISGIYVDSSARVQIADTEIGWTSGSGLVSYAGDIEADNVLIHNSGRNGIQLALGGSHQFRYCTIANYGNTAEALSASNVFCLDPLCSDAYVLPLTMSFVNCILTGNNQDEITMIDGTAGSPGAFTYQFTHSLVRVKDLLKMDQWPDFFDQSTNCLNYTFGQPLFRDLNMDDFHLDTLSVVEGMAIPIPSLSQDLDGVDRDMVMPDMGCFEYVD